MYGATKEQWAHFVSIGLTHDLLPVVSNPNAKISAASTLKAIGKVPSKYNNGEIVGISEWTMKKATDKAIENWSSEPDYGICIQTRHLRAFDIDIESELSNEIKQTILTFFPDAVFRTRENSLKFVFPFFLNGDHHKRTIQTKEGIIEFLANGQQFIAAGTHPSGTRYNLPLSNYPTLSEDDFETLFSHILEQYGSIATYSGSRKPKGINLDIHDDRVEHLTALGYGREGQIFIECPFKDEHTTPSSISATCYFPAGTRAYQQGHFCCLHGHCQGRTNSEFDIALGIIDFDPIEPAPLNLPESSPNVTEITIPRGLIKDTVEWITETAFKPQPEYALLSTLAFAAAVFGRRYKIDEPFNTRSNVYMISIGSTGSGKDHPRKSIKQLAELTNLYRYIGPDKIKAGEGVLTALTKKPSMVMMLDEFGMLLESMGNKNSYRRETAQIITELYSSSSILFQGGVYSDPKKDPINIQCPNLCIFGTTTLDVYREALNPRVVNSGELNRFIIMPPKHEFPERNFNLEKQAPPQHVIDGWQSISDSIEIGSFTESDCEPIPVTFTTETREIINDLWRYEDNNLATKTDGTGPLYARYTENILKIAMIFAIAENHDKPLLSSIFIDVGRQIVDKSIDFMRLLVQSGIGQTSEPSQIKTDPLIEKIYDFIKIQPRTKTEITRQFRTVHSVDIDKVINTLTYQARIKADKVKGVTKTAVMYTAV